MYTFIYIYIYIYIHTPYIYEYVITNTTNITYIHTLYVCRASYSVEPRVCMERKWRNVLSR